MNLTAKKVLLINLNDLTSDVKTYAELYKFIGGVGIGLKLYQILFEKDPVIFSVGPLNGFFPFASKTSIVLNHWGVIEDIYLGGKFSTCLAYAGVDSIAIFGHAKTKVILDITDTNVRFADASEESNKMGLPGKRASLIFKDKKLYHSNYYTTPDVLLEDSFNSRNLAGLVVTGTSTFEIADFEKYTKLYHKILERKFDLSIGEGINPPCSNCPMGCAKSSVGEIGGNVLIHSLVACHFADAIYSDIGIVFACLNSLGYKYSHEDLENLPSLIEDILKKLS